VWIAEAMLILVATVVAVLILRGLNLVKGSSFIDHFRMARAEDNSRESGKELTRTAVLVSKIF